MYNWGMPALILFVFLPLLEIAAFIEAGKLLGVGTTILLVIASSMLGFWIMGTQGYATWGKARAKAAQDQFPLFEMFDGLCLFLAGVLLILPGLITSTLGLLLVIPPIRKLLFVFLQAREDSVMRTFHDRGGRTFFYWNSSEDHHTHHDGTGNKTIEGDYRRLDDNGKDDDKKA